MVNNRWHEKARELVIDYLYNNENGATSRQISEHLNGLKFKAAGWGVTPYDVGAMMRDDPTLRTMVTRTKVPGRGRRWKYIIQRDGNYGKV